MTGESFPYVFHYGAGEPRIPAKLGESLRVFTEDSFSGKLVAVEGKLREAAPFPCVNPLTGPIAVEDVRSGDILAIHHVSLTPALDGAHLPSFRRSRDGGKHRHKPVARDVRFSALWVGRACCPRRNNNSAFWRQPFCCDAKLLLRRFAYGLVRRIGSGAIRDCAVDARAHVLFRAADWDIHY